MPLVVSHSNPARRVRSYIACAGREHGHVSRAAVSRSVRSARWTAPPSSLRPAPTLPKTLGANRPNGRCLVVGAFHSQGKEFPEDLSEAGELIELHVSGLSVSPSGFAALLSPQLCSIAEPESSLEAAFQSDCRALAVQITSGGADQERAESIEALTLLQLVQDIDVAVRLPYEALMQACEGIPDGSMLQQVRLQSIPVPAAQAVVGDGFCSQLLVDEQWYSCTQPFEAVGLALRYKAPIFMEEVLFQQSSISSGDCLRDFPDALPVEESKKQAHGITHNISVAWRAGATPIGDSDIAQLRDQLRK